ncbi:hypothetical protein, partial [Escherichia coli]|uniref:hypothetical protein n=1 Tax=Escherichia coli TaxID=562 RepID=UPI00195DA587
TPQPKLRRAVPALSKTISLPDFVKGERSECHLPLTTLRIKQAWQWWGWRGATPSTCQTAVDFDLLAACCPNDFA